MTDPETTRDAPNQPPQGLSDSGEKGCILAVDDAPENIEIIRNLLEREYQIKAAVKGRKALEIARRKPQPDLILLDIMMPEMDGLEVCRALKADPDTAHIPIIFITGKNEAANEIEGFELGAADYITKPFNPAVVRARVHTHLLLQREQRKVERLLENILPRKIIQDIKVHGFSAPEMFDPVTIMFAELIEPGFSDDATLPGQLITELTDIFATFDSIVAGHGAERIKTSGDTYLAVCGMPARNPDHADIMVRVARDFLKFLSLYRREHGKNWNVRIGLHTGSVVGGIVGRNRYLYDIFGDGVSIASRVQKAAEPMTLVVSDPTWELVREEYTFSPRGSIEVERKGIVRLFKLTVS